MTNRIKIAISADSSARVLAERARSALAKLIPAIESLILPISFTEKDLFSAFQADLSAGSADIALCPWLQVPRGALGGVPVAATLAREDVRGVLLIREEAASARDILKITSCCAISPLSLRLFLSKALPFSVAHFEIKPSQESTEKALAQFFNNTADAIVIQKSDLDALLTIETNPLQIGIADLRENLSRCRFMVLPASRCTPAAGAGATAALTHSKDKDVSVILSVLDDAQAEEEVTRERAIAAALPSGETAHVVCFKRDFGTVEFTDATPGHRARIARTHILPRAKSFATIWPEAKASYAVSREMLPVDLSSIPSSNFFFCAKASAWPENFTPDTGSVVWTAGLSTWFALAKQGLWVHGSAEGLGEEEDPRLTLLVPSLKYGIKFTHADTVSESKLAIVSTYRVTRDLAPVAEQLKNCTHFFWSSVDEFRAAVAIVPEILNGFHGAGPGKTYRYIATQVSDPQRIAPYLSLEEFKLEVAPRAALENIQSFTDISEDLSHGP